MVHIRKLKRQTKSTHGVKADTSLQLNELLLKGFAFHQRGYWKEAWEIYNQALKKEPNNFNALQLAGAVAVDIGYYEQAASLLSSAIKLSKNQSLIYHNLGVALAALSKFDAAIASFNEAIRLEPSSAASYFNVGNAHNELKEFDNAITSYDKAILINHNYSEAYFNRGNAQKNKKQYAAALDSYDKVIGITPNDSQAYCNRGNVLQEMGDYEAAIVSYKKAITLSHNYAEAYSNLGNTYQKIKQLQNAVKCHQKAINLNPNYAEAYSNLGNSLQEIKEYEAAIISYKKAIGLNPRFSLAFTNLAFTQIRLNQIDEAEKNISTAINLNPFCAYAYHTRGNLWVSIRQRSKSWIAQAMNDYDKAIDIDPNFSDAYFSKSATKLLLGDYDEGWMLYEWRWKTTGLKSSSRTFFEPLWLGNESIKNKTLLIHAEQGLGDSIQFCRYIDLVKDLGPKQIILEAPQALILLLSTLKNKVTLIKQGDEIPPFDMHCPMMSLPHAFKTTVTTIPADIPYLYAQDNKTKLWKDKLGLKTKLRIGLVWSGSNSHENDLNRSLLLRQLTPIFDLSFEFHSLQKEIRPDDLEALNVLNQVHQHQDALNDFSDTAALIANMDLVISVDTSVAHLTGAMGKKVFILLPFAPDYRWMLDREDSPWYPTATLCRQTAINDWNSAIDQVKLALLNLQTTNVL